MLDFLLGDSAKLYAILGGLVTLVTGAIYFWRKADVGGYQRKELENAKAERERLAKIKRAADAKPAHGVQSDPHNRDNRGKG